MTDPAATCSSPTLNITYTKPGNRNSGSESGGSGSLALLAKRIRKVITMNVQGAVNWFSVRNRYDFISRNDDKEDMFIYQTTIERNNLKKYLHGTGNGQSVFGVVDGEKGAEIANVTGLCRVLVQGRKYAANHSHYGCYP
jgi:cold shock CspA family protein